MLPIMSGTIYSMGKMAELESRWQQKKESGKIFQKEMTAEERMMARYQEDLENMRKNDTMNSIANKLRSGQELTPDEVQYLQRNNPMMYKEYQEIKGEKEAYERELKNCRTKEEAERLKINKMNGYLAEAKSVMNNPNIPKGQKKALMEKILGKTLGIEKAHMEFVNSGRYASLPTDEELAEEKERKNGKVKADAEEIRNNTQESGEMIEDAGKEGILTEETESGGMEDKGSSGKVIIADMSLPELDGKAEDVFEEVRGAVTDYLIRNRDRGYGLELFGYNRNYL